MKTFKDIIAWQKGFQLTLEIYKLTAGFPSCEEFGLKSQIRRASVSVISNIAEGFKRKGLKDQLHFYNMSQASLEELKCQLLLAHGLNYINDADFKNTDAKADETARILYGWIQSQARV